MKQKLTTLLALLCITVMSWAGTVTIPTALGQYIATSESSTTGNINNNDNGNLGGIYNGASATFTLNNTVAQDMVFTFKMGRAADGGNPQAKVTLTSGSTTVFTTTANFANTGSWTPSDLKTYNIADVPTGELKLKFEFSTGSGYVGNLGSIAFYSAEGFYSQYDQIPGAIDLTKGAYSTARVEGGGNVGYVSNGASATYTVYNTVGGNATLNMGLTKYGEGTLTAVVTDVNTGNIEVTKPITITSDVCKGYDNPTAFELGYLTKGLKTIKFTAATTSSYLCNYKNVSIDIEGAEPPTPVLDPESIELIYDAAYTGSTVTVAESLTKQGNFNGHNSFKFSYNGSATFSAPGKIITGIKITSYNYPADKSAAYTVASTKAGSTAKVITPVKNTVTSNSAASPEEVLFIINDAEANESFKLQMDGWFDAFSYFTVYYKDGPLVEQEILTMSIDGLSLNATQIATLNADKAIDLTVTTAANDVVVSLSDGSAATINGKGTNLIKINDKWTVNLTKHVYNAATGDKNTTIIPAQPYYSTPSTDGIFSVNIGGDSRFKMSPGTFTITAPSNVIIKQVTFNNIYENYDGDANSTIAVTATSGTVNAPFFNVLDRTGRVLKFTVDGAEPGASVSFTIGGSKQKAMGNLIIDYAEAASTTAPVVKSTSVTDATHKNHAAVTITFDHSVAEAIAKVGGTNCRIQGLGTPTIKIGAWNLPWNATSTVTLPAGSMKDASGNATTEDITVDITVGSQEDYIISEFDYTVSNITELKAALDATKNNGDDRKTIFLKNGTYNANDLAASSSENDIKACQLSVGKNVSLIGESLEGVSIIYYPFAEGMGERTITLNDGDYAQDITFRTGIPVGEGRGVALYTQGKHIILNNCRALGGQDTYLTGGSCYWKGGVIEGTTDFIFGSGDCLFDGTVISTLGGPITAANHSATTEWGYVFKGCTIKAGKVGIADKDYQLGRPWQGEPRVAFIDTDMKIVPTDEAWGTMGKKPTHYFEYNSTKNGVAVDLSKRFCPDSENQTTKGVDYTLTAAQAAEFTMENIFGEVDGWYPAEEIPVVIQSYTVAMPACGWASMAVNFNAQVPEGATAYYASSKNITDGVGTIRLMPIETGEVIPAGEGVVVKGSGNVTFTQSAVAPVEIENIFSGTAAGATTVSANSAWVLNSSESTIDIPHFSIFTGTTIPSNKAYIASESVAGVKSLAFSFDAPTGIHNVESSIKNSAAFNLVGQRVAANAKGIVIINGKKYNNK